MPHYDSGLIKSFKANTSSMTFPLLLNFLKIMVTFSTIAMLRRKRIGQKTDKCGKVRGRIIRIPLFFTINLKNNKDSGKADR